MTFKNEPTASSLPFSVFRFAAILTVACLVVFSSKGANASEPVSKIICEQSAALKCSAEEMRDELKCHMRGAKCYAKMLIVNARIKTRSASVHRRIKRNPCYRGLARDIEKLNELTCEFVSIYEDVISCSNCGCGKPICGSTVRIAEQLSTMVALANGMRAASLGLAPANVIPNEASLISEIYPNHEIAPSVPSVVDHAVRIVDGDSSPVLEGPVIDRPGPNSHSVLKKQ